MKASLLAPAGRPRIVGVVNITEDSFSDGGLYVAPEDALAHAGRLRSDGADIIELGPASSHPDTERVPAEEQRRRLAPVIDRLAAEGVPVSVDSFLPDTQRFAMAQPVGYLNDIQGFPERTLYPLLAEPECRLIVMHSVQRRGPATKVVTDAAAIWASIERLFDERLTELQAAGIARERLIVTRAWGSFLAAIRSRLVERSIAFYEALGFRLMKTHARGEHSHSPRSSRPRRRS